MRSTTNHSLKSEKSNHEKVVDDNQSTISKQPFICQHNVDMKTSMGNIEIELFNDKAPVSAKILKAM